MPVICPTPQKLQRTDSVAFSVFFSSLFLSFAFSQSIAHSQCASSPPAAPTLLLVISASTTAPASTATPNVSGPCITVDSSYPGYSATPIDDSVINASGGIPTTWASSETVTDHWIDVAFPSPRQINSATIHWVFNSYQETYMTAQLVNLQYWNGVTYQTISSLVYPGSDVSSSSASFATVTTSQLRFVMPAGQGSPTILVCFGLPSLITA